MDVASSTYKKKKEKEAHGTRTTGPTSPTVAVYTLAYRVVLQF